MEIIIIIIMGLKSVSASLDVIGDLSSPLDSLKMKFRMLRRGGKKVGGKNRVGSSIKSVWGMKKRSTVEKGAFSNQIETMKVTDSSEVVEEVNCI